MRTTIDIPDQLYREIKIAAASRGVTVREILLASMRCVKPGELSGKKFARPIIHSNRKDKLKLTNEQIYDLVDFP